MTATFDPVTFEILRHRLTAINDEAAVTIAFASGSPVATEAYDFNSALMTASGDVVLVGQYIVAHAAAMDLLVKHLIAEYADNPGIGPGDMFMTNDPYIAAMHQPDVVVAAPIFVDGELVAWCGSVVHQSDVGGPLAGSVGAGAASIYQEAIPLAPVRIVEAGRVRKDIEREFLIRSRTPELNALDTRAQIAANNVHAMGFAEVCATYGTATVTGCMEWLIDTTTRRFEQRLRGLPDGEWSHTCHVEHDGRSDEVYRVELILRKVGGTMELDFRGSDDQAEALINCSQGTLRGYALGALLPLLAYDMSWVPAGMWRQIEIRTRLGSVVDAQWPAGVSMGNSSVGHAVRTCVNICVSKLLDSSPELADRALASCMSFFCGQNISGRKQSGAQYGTMLFDSLGGGGGAYAVRDGIDTAGIINAPASSISNVEVLELNYPLRYLWRRQLPDSAGPGRYRGGVGGEHAFVLHQAGGDMAFTCFGTGVEQPASAGLRGGEPGSPNSFRLVRAGPARVKNPDDLRYLEDVIETLEPKASSALAPGDVFVHQYSGGGGFGDPLDRLPDEVLADVADGLVSPAAARGQYFVVLAGDAEGGWAVDPEATAADRAAERGRRAALPDQAGTDADGLPATCPSCGAPVGAPQSETQLVGARWPVAAPLAGTRRFGLRSRYCRGCTARLAVDVVLDRQGLGPDA